MNQFKSFIGICILLAAAPSLSYARDLQGRVGLGYNAQFANFREVNGVPAIALKYGFTKDLAVEGIVGVATTHPGNSAIGMKFFKKHFLRK